MPNRTVFHPSAKICKCRRSGVVSKTNRVLFLFQRVLFFKTAETRRHEFETSLRTVLGVLTNLQKCFWLWNLSCVAENARLRACSLSLHKYKQRSYNPEDICRGSNITIFTGAHADINRCLDWTCELKKTCMNMNIRLAMGDKIIPWVMQSTRVTCSQSVEIYIYRG